MRKGNSPNSRNGLDGVSVPAAFKLDHLQSIKPLLFRYFCNFYTCILGDHFLFRGPIIGKGNSSNSKTEWDRRVSVPGAFKLDHLQSIKPLLFRYFCNFYTFILGDHFLLPQRANNGKREFIQLQNWMRQRVSSAWGIQTGLFAGH